MKYKLNEALDFIEMPEFKDKLTNTNDYHLLVKNVEDFRENLRKQKKSLAKKYHPDINPDGVKDLKEINMIIDALMTINVKPMPPRRTVIVKMYPPGNFYRYTDFTGEATTGTYY
jgi:hypothetical protein